MCSTRLDLILIRLTFIILYVKKSRVTRPAWAAAVPSGSVAVDGACFVAGCSDSRCCNHRCPRCTAAETKFAASSPPVYHRPRTLPIPFLLVSRIHRPRQTPHRRHRRGSDDADIVGIDNYRPADRLVARHSDAVAVLAAGPLTSPTVDASAAHDVRALLPFAVRVPRSAGPLAFC